MFDIKAQNQRVYKNQQVAKAIVTILARNWPKIGFRVSAKKSGLFGVVAKAK